MSAYYEYVVMSILYGILYLMNTTQFRRQILAHYRHNHRDFPWRRTRDPYRILVSEIMLQQSQTDRVIPFYKNFLRRFPSFQTLAAAPLRDVLRAWSGLGYNRRALYLKHAAEIVVRDFRGRLPRDPDVLRQFPGIGPYTAAAVACFAFGQPTVFIETNIRTVFIHSFFPLRSRGTMKVGGQKIPDSQLIPLIRSTLDIRNPRDWYYALMDYGAHLKRTLPTNPGRRSAHHARQAPFRGSLREVRGAVVRNIAAGRLRATLLMHRFGRQRLQQALADLAHDGFIKKSRR